MLRARDVLVVLPLDRSVAQAVARRGKVGLSTLATKGGSSAMARVARAAIDADPEERVPAIEDTLATVREEVVGRLLWLRVLAPAASALGLAGTAVQASWAHDPPGLLALDPDRVFGIAASAGAICLALGFAGSTTALGALFFLRRRALDLLGGVDRVAEVARDAWTARER